MPTITPEWLASLAKNSVGMYTAPVERGSDKDTNDEGGRPILAANAFLEVVLAKGFANPRSGDIHNAVFQIWRQAYVLEEIDHADDDDETLWPVYLKAVRRTKQRIARESGRQ